MPARMETVVVCGPAGDAAAAAAASEPAAFTADIWDLPATALGEHTYFTDNIP